MNREVRLTISVPSDLRDMFQKAASDDHRSLSSLAKIAILQLLDERGYIEHQEPKRRSRSSRARENR